MSILATLFNKQPQARPGNADDFWYTDPATGFRLPAMFGTVTADTAMRVAAVYACVRVISETAASLPLILYRRLSNEGKERAKDHPLYGVLHNQPNRRQTSFQFVEQMTAYALLRGRGVAVRVVGFGGRMELVPVHPDVLKVESNDDGMVMYTVKNPRTHEETTYTQDEVFDLQGLSWDGVNPVTPITMARNTILLAQSAEEFGTRFFDGDSMPRIALSTPKRLDDKAHERMKRSWEGNYSGGVNAHKAVILEEDTKPSIIGMTGRDAQFIETRQFQAKEIARIFRVPPHKIGIMDDATFSNIEQQSMEFVTDTMMPWLRRWETALQRDVIPDDDLFAEFLLDSLLRGDTLTRYMAYSKGINDGWLTRNEARVKENMNPADGLDAFLESQNTRPAGEGDGASDTGQRPPANGTPPDVMSHYLSRRIADRELNAISKRAKHADDNRDRFNTWLDEWIGGHADYIRSELQIFDCVSEASIATIVDGLRSSMNGADPAAVVERLKTTRAADIAAVIMQGVSNNGTVN